MARKRSTAWILPFFPPLIAVLLALPCFSFGWLWDDYDFLARAQTFRLSYLLPDPGAIFYRPLSRELYFGALWRLGHDRPLLGHIANAALLATATWLLIAVARRLVGARAGLLAGLAFACLGASPVLVGWASGAQELIAAIFLLLALRAQISGRSLAAAIAFGAALLSKETALAAIPVLIALPWLLHQRQRPWRHVAPFAALLIAWTVLHPGLRILMERHLAHQSEGQVGLGAPGRWPFLARSALTLLNLPVQGTATPWPDGRLSILVLALAGIAVTALVLGKRGRQEERVAVPLRGALLAAILLAAGTLGLASALIPIWAPYYCVLPAIGTSILIGVGLERLPTPAVLAALGCFAVSGVWSRGASPDPLAPCERNFEVTDRALKRVEHGFKALHPELPRGAHVLLSVAGTGGAGVFTHMFRFQALRVWYADSSLLTLPPSRPRGGAQSRFLMRITKDLAVVDIDLQRMDFKTDTGEPNPSDPESSARFAYSEVFRPLRAYALGVAQQGEWDDAIRIELALAEREAGGFEAYDRRLAGMFLLLSARDREAEQLLHATPHFPTDSAVPATAKLLIEAGAFPGIDGAAFRAFEVDSTSVTTLHELVRQLRVWGGRDPALRLARRVQALAPGDRESAEAIRTLEAESGPDRLTTQVESVIP